MPGHAEQSPRPMYMDDGETFRCEACGKEFESERALQAHVRAVGLVD
jgi:uncharacterized C2H2 Zn-finger protein